MADAARAAVEGAGHAAGRRRGPRRARIASSLIASALEDGRDAAVAQDEHPVGDVDELGQVAGIEQDGVALRGEVAHQLEDLALGADVDAAGRVVEQEDPRLGQEHLAEDHLLLVAAGERAGRLLRASRP